MIRTYRPESDAEALWTLKQQFELGLGEHTGEGDKKTAYRSKIDDAYRQRYLEWAAECVAGDEDCIVLAEFDDEVVGYAFVLPEHLAMIWDAAVLNELFVTESHRGTDVADALMEAVLAIAEDQTLPMDRIVLDVDPENARARAFYERHGFEPWGDMVARPL